MWGSFKVSGVNYKGSRIVASGFLTGLKIRANSDGTWMVDAPLIYVSGHLNAILIVPAGFRTDLASVPRIPVVFWLFGDRAHHESVVHDYLYRRDSAPRVSRADADRVFLEAMRAKKKSAPLRWAMYAGVRMGGERAYHRRTVEEKS
jgi:hypothetical protein